MYGRTKENGRLAEIEAVGLTKGDKAESGLTHTAASAIGVGDGGANFCANNYLGLADHPM